MSQRTTTWLARGLCALCIVITIAGLSLEAVNRAAGMGAFIYPNGFMVAVVFPIVGMVIATRQPRNAVGWLFCLIGAFEALTVPAIAYAVYTLSVNPGALPGGELMSWLAYWAFFPGITVIPFALSLFPNGRLLSPRWRWLAWVTVAGVAIGTMWLAWVSWPLRGAAILPYLRAGANIEDTSTTLFYPTTLFYSVGLLISAIGSIVAIGLRLYRARGVERQQMKWCVYAIVFVVGLQPVVLAAGAANQLAAGKPLAQLVLALHSLSFIGLAVAIGFAILKYRLYDIDLIINRTLVYGAITAILTAIWVTSTTFIQQATGALVGGESAAAATVISTVVVISLFQPLRSVLENWVNERFYPENLDLMRDFVELSLVTFELAEIAELVVRRIGGLMLCNASVVFLRCGDSTFAPAAHWPADLDGLGPTSLPSQMHDRWGRARTVQQPDDKPFRLLVPLYIPRLRQEEVVGILALGPRPSGQGYSWGDRRGLTNFGKEVGKKLLAAQLAQRKEKPVELAL